MFHKVTKLFLLSLAFLWMHTALAYDGSWQTSQVPQSSNIMAVAQNLHHIHCEDSIPQGQAKKQHCCPSPCLAKVLNTLPNLVIPALFESSQPLSRKSIGKAITRSKTLFRPPILF